MQNIQIIIEDESRKELERSDVNFADILNTVWETTNKIDFPWTWSIDAYGLTIFNLNQLSYLKSELEKISKDLNQQGKEIIEKLLNFIEKMEQHKYLVFIGD